MIRKTLLIYLALVLFATAASAHEPGGFNGNLYAAEVVVGSAMTVTPILFGIIAYSSAVA